MSLQEDLVRFITKNLSELRTIYDKVAKEVPDEVFTNRLVTSLVASSYSLMNTQQPEIKPKAFASLGEVARKFYRDGDQVFDASFLDTDLFRSLSAPLSYVRCDTRTNMIKAWSYQAMKTVPSNLLETPKFAASFKEITKEISDAIAKPIWRVTGTDVINAIPHARQTQLDSATWLAFHLTKNTIDSSPEILADSLNINLSIWYPAIQAMRKDVRYWRIGMTASNYFVICDGYQVAAGPFETKG